MLTRKKMFGLILVSLVLMSGFFYKEYTDRFEPLGNAFGKLKAFTTAFDETLDIVSAENKQERKEVINVQEFVTEEEALKDPPLTDIRTTVSVANSIVKLKGNKHSYTTGESVELQIILRDGRGMRRTRGGDKLRARMYNDKQGAYIAGHVTDHDNGSYSAKLPATWPGPQTISVFLAYTREAVRAIYYTRKQIPGTREIDAVFQKGAYTEATLCHADHHWLMNYSSVCNLTQENDGMSWFCGKPTNKKLSCKDWSFTKYASKYAVLPLTKAEEQMFKEKWELFPDLKIEVKGNLYKSGNLSSCYSYPRQPLWNLQEPAGFFYDNKWQLRHCKQPDRTVYSQCLQSKYLMISGDSTTRQWYSYLLNHMGCKQISERWTTKTWHRNAKCVISKFNLTVEWIPHSQPFIPGKEWDLHKYGTKCIANIIKEIGNKRNIIFVLHMYMHFTAFHHSIFLNRMRYITESVRQLLNKNNNVTFLIKGPHTFKTQVPATHANRLNDYFGYVYKDIMFRAFEGLHDRIVYLENAEISTAKAVENPHPPDEVVKAAVFQMFGYICTPT